MPVIALVVAAWGGSAGALGGPLAFKGPARHDLRPALGLWGGTSLGPLTLTGEVLGSWRARESLEHRVLLGRVSAVFGPSTGNDRVHIGIGAGPAVVVRSGSAGGLGFTAVSPAIRVLTHFDLQFGKTPLVARYQLGSTTRGIRAWDFDASLGLGVGW